VTGPERDEVTGEWRGLHNAELNDLHSSSSIFRVMKSRRMRWVVHVAHMEERRGAYRILVGKPEGKIPLEGIWRRWEDGSSGNVMEGIDWLRRGTGGGLL
jgi:hypothetical protein